MRAPSSTHCWRCCPPAHRSMSLRRHRIDTAPSPRRSRRSRRWARSHKAYCPAGASQRFVGAVPCVPALRALRKTVHGECQIRCGVRDLVASHDGRARRVDRTPHAAPGSIWIFAISSWTPSAMYSRGSPVFCGRRYRPWSAGPCGAPIASTWCRAASKAISFRAIRIAHIPGSPTVSMMSFCARTGLWKKRSVWTDRCWWSTRATSEKGRDCMPFCRNLPCVWSSRVRFRVIGDGGRRELLLELLQQAGAHNVEVLPPMPRAALLKTYLSADILFLHLNAHAAFEKVLPSKIFEYAATGKPIWAGVAGYAAKFIADEVPNAAVFTPCNASQAIEKLAGLILQDRPRRDFVNRYARRNIASAMANDILLLARADLS